MQVWSSGFYGETINYLDVAYSERSCLVFDHSLLCVVDDYCVCLCVGGCVGVCDWEFQTATCNIVAHCKETGRIKLCEDAAAECIQTAVRSFLTPAADQMDNMLPPHHYSTETGSKCNTSQLHYWTKILAIRLLYSLCSASTSPLSNFLSPQPPLFNR